MYAAHAALALAARGMRDEPPLGAMLFAALAPDTIKVAILVGGLPKTVADAWSHSLPALGVLAAAAAVAAYPRWRGGGAFVLVALVLAHVVLDFIFWREPLWPGRPPMGLALARHAKAEYVVEAFIVLVGWVLYRRTIPLRSRNRWPMWALLLGLLGAQAAFVWKLLVD